MSVFAARAGAKPSAARASGKKQLLKQHSLAIPNLQQPVTCDFPIAVSRVNEAGGFFIKLDRAAPLAVPANSFKSPVDFDAQLN